jgi:hypothetical protein|tara:strand:- start:7890 stop:8240 length:351 start_codon:yes stop_codon:yes gene_type:complete
MLSVSERGIVTQVGAAVGQDLVANGDGEVLFRVRTSIGHIVKSGVGVIAMEGQSDPVLPVGVTFGNFDTGALTMNRAGRFAFYAELAGSATVSYNEAFWTAGPWSPQVYRLGPTKA